MPASDALPFRLYRDKPLFREALSATAAATGFPARLIEKDYFCSVILQHLGSSGLPLVFKGGTMLTKIHAGFYRLSEDLDFSVSTPADTPRSQRSRLARPLRSALDAIEGALPGLVLRQRLLGANNSTQYSALIAYQSLLGAAEETIKFEVGLREPLLRQPVRGTVKTILLDPVSGAAIVPGF